MVASPLSTRQVAELMEARGVHVDHSTSNRWVITYSPPREEAFHRRRKPVWVSWRMDATSSRVTGEWRYLSRAVDTSGETVDVLRTAHRDQEAALRCLKQAIRRNGVPETSTMAGSDATEAAITRDHEAHGTHIIMRPVTYFNNIVEQDHRAVKRVTRPLLGFNAFAAAQATLAGIELMHRLKTRQLVVKAGDEGLTATEQFDALAASSAHR